MKNNESGALPAPELLLSRELVSKRNYALSTYILAIQVKSRGKQAEHEHFQQWD
jgi:hypothetical protein